MTPAHKSAIASRGSELDLDLELPYDLKEHMNTMFALGYSLMPLGKGPDGKEPTMEFEGRSRFPLKVVGKRMALIGASMFGVRCDGLVVVDIDNMEPATLEYVDRCFGSSPYVVRTQDGEHRYYRADTVQKFRTAIRIGQIEIDLKHGANSYVVGPGSVRHDNGFTYNMVGEPLPAIHELPVFRDRDASTGSISDQAERANSLGAKPIVVGLSGRGVQQGERFNCLTREAREFVQSANSEQSLFEDLRAHAELTFEDAATFPETTMRSIAKWTWEKRAAGQIWGGRNSAVTIERHEILALDKFKNGDAANRLLQELRHNHGGQPGKRFKIAGKSMARDSVISGWKKNQNL